MARNVIDADEALRQIQIYGWIMDINVNFRAKMTRVVMIYQHQHAYCLRVFMLSISDIQVSLFFKMYANNYRISRWATDDSTSVLFLIQLP